MKTMDKEAQYWLDQFAGEWVKTGFPYDHEPLDNRKRSLDGLNFRLSQDLYDRLMQLRNESDPRLHMILLAGVVTLLHKYTDHDDIIVGVPIYRQDVEGQFVNTVLALRHRLNAQMTFKDLLLMVRQTVIDADENKNYPLEALLFNLNLSFSDNHFPLFEVAVLLENIHDREDILHVYPNIIFSFSRRDGAIGLTIDYNGIYYEPATIEKIFSLFSNLMAEALNRVERKIFAIEMLSRQEREKLIVEFNRTGTVFPEEQTIHRLFEDRARQIPDHTALVYEDTETRQPVSMKYSELDGMANRWARCLRRRGMKPGAVAAVMLEPSAEMVAVLLGILKAGGAYLPIDPRLPRERVLTMLNDSAASILITNRRAVKRNLYTFLQGLNNIGVEPHFTSPRQQISNLDRLPFPNRSLVDYETYSRYIGQVMVKNTIALHTARGCPYNCAYCSKIWGRQHVFRSARNVFDEMQIYYDMGVRRFSIFDDIFNLNRQNGLKFFELIIKHGLDVQLFFPNGLRGDRLTRDYIDLLVEAGLTATALALETASPRLQKLIQKHLDLDKFRENAEYFCKKYPQVVLELFSIHGFPGETKEEARMTLDFIKSLKWVHFPYIFNLKIYPHTPMAKLAMAHGISSQDIFRSEDLAFHDISPTSPFEREFTTNYQAEFINDYFLSKERLLHVLPYQLRVMTRNELVQKYDSYFPTELKQFGDLLEFLDLKEEELAVEEFLSEEAFRVADLNHKIKEHFRAPEPANDALKVLLLDLSQYFSSETDLLYDVVEPPLGAAYIMTYLQQRFGNKIDGKVAKSRIDFDSHEELKELLDDFKPQVIGIRGLTFFRDFFHATVGAIRQWGFDGPIIAGGPYATRNAKGLLQDRNIDLLVISEGEVTFSELIEKIMENNGRLPSAQVLKNIDGIAFIPAEERATEKFARDIIQLDELSSALSRHSAEPLERVNCASDPAYIIYTSGSTGTPKGVIVEHRNVVNVLSWFGKAYSLDRDTRVLQMTHYTFDPSVEQIFGTLLHGAVLYLTDRELITDREAFIRFVDKYRINIINAVPGLLKELLGSDDRLKSLRAIIAGGEKLEDGVKERIMEKGYHLYNHYGPTETTIEALAETCSTAPVSLGRPIANTTCYVLDGQGRVVPIGVRGELFVGGAGVSRGYLNNPEMTGRHFVANPFAADSPVPAGRMYRTGDFVKWHSDGRLEFWGRLDHQVKVRGYRIELAEIEARLSKHRAVKEAVVIDRTDKEGNTYLTAYYVPRQAEGRPEFMPSVGEYVIWDDRLYYAMGSDEAKNNCFKAAVNRLVKGKTVVEIGTGRDLLMARFAVDAGARKVYAIEILEEYYQKAADLARQSGLEETIVVIQGDSRDVELPERVDINLSNQIGAIGSSEGAVVLHNDARRFLKDEAVVIPDRCVTRIAAVSLPDELRENPVFSGASKEYAEKIFKKFGGPFDLRLCVRNLPLSHIISNEQIFEDLRFQETMAEESSRKMRFTINREGKLDGFILWLNLYSIEGESVDTLKADHIWKPFYIPAFSPPLDVCQGDVIEAEGMRTLGENTIFPDYGIKGSLIKSDGDTLAFAYDLPYFEKSYRKNPLYRKLFSHQSAEAPPDAEMGPDDSELRAFLKRALPEYMIPAHFIPLKTMPLSAGGKVDRRALLSMTVPAPGKEKKVEYGESANEVEGEMVKIWQEVLGREEIGVDENFFTLGGDSIKAIQIVSKMKKAGYKIKMGDIFRNPVISSLAPKVTRLHKTVNQTMVTGQVPLVPAQVEFFRRIKTDPYHYNQAVMLLSEEGFDKEGISAVFQKIQAHHDALRTTFEDVNGEIVQVNHGLDYPLFLEEYYPHDLEGGADALVDKASELQGSIRLQKGPLLKLRLFHLHDGDRLLIVIHHLVMDGVSWRILFDDLETLYRQYRQKEPLTLPEKSHPFKSWAEGLQAYAVSEECLAELPYWQQIESVELPEIKKDFEGGDNRVGDAAVCLFRLTPAETESLLGPANEAFGTEVNDLLLAALALSVRRAWGHEGVCIALEGHGREEILSDLDIHRAVGWFTSVYPVLLDTSHEEDLSRHIKETKESLRKIPRKGIGYGILRYVTPAGKKQGVELKRNPQISFNYLGQFDAQLANKSFVVAKESTGSPRSPRQEREYELDIIGMTGGHRFTLSVTYSRNQFTEATIENWLSQYEDALRRIITLCLGRQEREMTPGDFAYNDLSIEEVEEIEALFDESSS